MENMKKEGEKIDFFNNKKGQITLFIIIAIVIVVLGVLIYLFYPKISAIFGGAQEQDPNAFIQNCVEDDLKNNLNLISLQGGSLDPEPYILYQDDKIQYLVYTEEFYQKGVVQKPFLEKQIEKEVKRGIQQKVKACFNELKTSFEDIGYEVSMKEGDINVNLIPQKVVATFNYSVKLIKSETKKYESFNVVVNNNLYELASIADSIVDLESEYGDADVSLYMDLYHKLKVEKKSPGYGTSIYVLTDRETNDKFQFAAKSVVMPPGYGVDIV